MGAGNTIGLKDGKPYLDFNNDTGLKVGESLVNIATHAGIQTGGDDPMTAGAQSGKVVAAVSGTWMADMFSTAFGDGFAATKLPTFKVDGVDTQMGSFGGYKVYGVNAFTQHPEQAMALAEFLSNETSQARRFELRKLGPSNLKVAESDAVKEDIALSALAQQGEFSYSQRDVSGSYWDPAAALATDLINGQTDVKALLDAMVQQVMN